MRYEVETRYADGFKGLELFESLVGALDDFEQEKERIETTKGYGASRRVVGATLCQIDGRPGSTSAVLREWPEAGAGEGRGEECGK